ncbi:MAG: helix-turn-helix domain-containing protein [Dehalococcoidia bacterium]
MPKIIVDLEEFYELNEATQMLNIGIATLFRWMKKGKIIPVRLSGRTLIPKKEVERLQTERAPRTKELSSAE